MTKRATDIETLRVLMGIDAPDTKRSYRAREAAPLEIEQALQQKVRKKKHKRTIREEIEMLKREVSELKKARANVRTQTPGAWRPSDIAALWEDDLNNGLDGFAGSPLRTTNHTPKRRSRRPKRPAPTPKEHQMASPDSRPDTMDSGDIPLVLGFGSSSFDETPSTPSESLSRFEGLDLEPATENKPKEPSAHARFLGLLDD